MSHVQEEQVLTWYEYITYSGISLGLVCMGGLMSGLTLGLLSLDQVSIKILKKTGTDAEKKYARRLLPILKHHHWLLVTLLLWNAAAMEALPIFLDKIVPEYLAIILSVTFVLIFGEVIPQAAISRFGLAVGGNLHWLVWILIFIGSPISWPISKLLDLVLGENHTTFYKRAELKELIGIHGEGEGGKGGLGLLSKDEVMVIRGALEMRDKTIVNLITPIEKVFMLEYNEKIDMNTIKRVLAYGHSRIPVYKENRQNVVGVLHVRNLIEIDPDDAIPVNEIQLMDCVWVDSLTPVWDMLNFFQTGKGHLAFVTQASETQSSHEVQVITSRNDDIPFGEDDDSTVESRGELIGIVTLEDIFEELIQEEIQDENDVHKGELQRQVRIAEIFRRVSAPINTETTAIRQDGFQSRSRASLSNSMSRHKYSKSVAAEVPIKKGPLSSLIPDDNYFGSMDERPIPNNKKNVKMITYTPETPLLNGSANNDVQSKGRSVSWSLK